MENIMEENKNLEQMTKEVSDLLFDAKSLLDILCDIIDCDRKEDFLLSSAIKNIDNAFNCIEDCRKLISNAE